MKTLRLREVAAQLDLSPQAQAWLGQIEQPVEQPRLPDDEEADDLLTRLGVGPQDRVNTLAARPDSQQHPALWWVLEKMYQHTIETMGEPVPIEGHFGWPATGVRAGAPGRHLAVWAYLAALPEVRRYHATHGIPDEISWSSLQLGPALVAHRSITGASGLGLFDGLWSPPLQLRGIQYRGLGRLEYTRGRLSLSNGPCGYTVGVHIPSGAPLESRACGDSLDLALQFFTHHFPDEPIAMFHCSSWLMDPQLAEYLPRRSNIVQFQRRFHIIPLASTDESSARCDQIREYLFATSAIDQDELDSLPQDTTLRQAYVQHRKAGRHWHTRTGWSPVD